MHHFTTDPVRVYNPEDVELSYDKRRVITEKIAKSLNQKIAEEAISSLTFSAYGIYPEDNNMLNAIKGRALYFDEGDYPESGRYVLLTATAYNMLLSNLTDVQTNAFLACADATTGVIGKIFGLNIMKRSSLGEKNGESIAFTSWHEIDYNFALSEVEIFTQENAPEYYGTVISASARFGVYYNPGIRNGN
jgi:hypothetical protein